MAQGRNGKTAHGTPRSNPAVNSQGRRKSQSYAAASSGNSRKLYRVRTKKAQPTQDYTFLFIVLFFLMFGLVMLYSTSSYKAGLEYGDTAHYLKRQGGSSVLGLIGMVVISEIPLKFWKKIYMFLYAFSLGMLLLIIPFGTLANGAKRWIYIGPISVQPAEISKFAVIILTAVWLSRIPPKALQTGKGIATILAPAFLEAGMIYVITKNLSSAIIVMVIAIGMLFVTAEDYRRYFVFAGIILAAAVGVVFWVMKTGGSGGTFRLHRIQVWLDPAAYTDGTGFQVLQGLYGIGSGGVFGKGLGQSMQKLGFLPEAQNDMIFSIICEELGLFGAISIIVLFIIMCWRMMVVATHASDLFGSLITVGVMIHIAVQVILNIAVVTNSIPNTGVTLPFFSYGGSAIMILLAEIGLVLNVAKHSQQGDAA